MLRSKHKIASLMAVAVMAVVGSAGVHAASVPAKPSLTVSDVGPSSLVQKATYWREGRDRRDWRGREGWRHGHYRKHRWHKHRKWGRHDWRDRWEHRWHRWSRRWDRRW